MVQSWYNNDGLYLKYGTDKTTPNIAGEYKTYGALREIELRMDLANVGSAATIMSDQVFFPKNARIEQVVIEVETAVTGTSGVLNVGLISTDRSTEIDFNGFIAAETKANLDTAGKKITYINGTTNAGALIGTTNATVGYICADYDTTALVGVVIVRIQYRGETPA